MIKKYQRWERTLDYVNHEKYISRWKIFWELYSFIQQPTIWQTVIDVEYRNEWYGQVLFIKLVL